MHMFCYQCQETGENKGCLYFGACGKTDETANLQDLLIYLLKGIALCARPAMAAGEVPRAEAVFASRSLFSTVTNTNFDSERFQAMIREGLALRDSLRERFTVDVPAGLEDLVTWQADGTAQLLRKSTAIDIRDTKDPDIRSLAELSTYGLKGAAAYAIHAAALGREDDGLWCDLLRILARLAEEKNEEALQEIALDTGRYMTRAMAVLDEANAAAYGEPGAVPIPLGVRGRPGILITGHDLKDLEELLEQTEGTGVDVYTHCEMWEAHAYPAFRKHAHLAGNYGNAWWMQDIEFEAFNGPILVTSNCITPVPDAYRHRIFTTGPAGYPGVVHIPEAPEGQPKDFSAIVALAKTCPPPKALEQGTVTGGFSHRFVAKHLDTVLGAIRSGAIRKFVVMGGCDGRDQRRKRFTDAALAMPDDTIILTAGCAKFRFIKQVRKEVAGLPQVLDAGQCNDCYSLVRIALALKDALGIADVNDLPIDFDLAWYDQKAVGIVLALAALGFRNVRMGPSLPAYLLTDAGKRFREKYGISG
ncbi:MAG: hydroxylamine reductase [Acidobacteria bacterium]|nr:hydroxylamine reductase [Acidobacteriota bacterium]